MKLDLCVLGLIVVTACGGTDSGDGIGPGDLVPGAGDDPGTGTGTLVLDGTVTAEPIVTNSADPGNFSTELTVRITRAGQPVSTGSVDITSAGGTVALVFDTVQMQWRGLQAGYHEVYALSATSDADSVSDVRIDGPDIHVIDAPLAGAAVDSALALAVGWTREEMAEEATIQTRDTNRIAIPDSGTYTVGAGTLRSSPDQAEDEELELTRAQRISPAGAAAGSSFRVQVRTRIDLVVPATNR